MTLTLQASGSADIVLCHGAEDTGEAGKFIGPLDEGETDVQWEIQESQPIGAAARAVHDRGNAEWVVEFAVWVWFATEALATAFRLGWPAGLPRTGAKLVADHGGGNTQTHNPAHLKRCRIVQNGLGCMVQYTFYTGAPT